MMTMLQAVVQNPAAQNSANNAMQWLSILIPTFTALAAAVIGVINALKTNTIATKTDDVVVKTDNIVVQSTELAKQSAVIAEKTVQMEQQGNSRWAAQAKKLEDAIRETAELKMLVAQLLPGARAEGVKKADEFAARPAVPPPVVNHGQPGEYGRPPAIEPEKPK
jgi:hypothetical protein